MNNPDKIILKYLQKDISLEEQHKLAKWLEENEDNKEVFKKMKSYWENYAQDYSQQKKAVEEKVFSQVGVKLSEKKSNQSSRTRAYLMVAATILMLLAFSGIFFWPESSTKNTVVASTPIRMVEKTSLSGQKITTVLPDGTKVRLNSGSRLIVPEKFSLESRSVELIGEAFFEVTRDESRPFHIITEDFTVKVLGTSFNIHAYTDASNFVAVKEGVVSVNADSYRSVELNANQMVEIFEDGDISQLYEVDENMVFGWVDQVLSFNDQSIGQVFKKVSRWYGVEIIIENKNISKKLFTATFNNPTLKELMVNVSKVYGFKYEIVDEKVIIR